MRNTDWKRNSVYEYDDSSKFHTACPRGYFKMWYEALPSAIIVYVLLSIPDKINSLSNKLVYNNVSIYFVLLTLTKYTSIK